MVRIKQIEMKGEECGNIKDREAEIYLSPKERKERRKQGREERK